MISFERWVSSSANLRTSAACASLTGKRLCNEDACLCLPDLGLFAVCDGMGGRAAGEYASHEAIRLLETHITATTVMPDRLRLDLGVHELLATILSEVHRALREQAAADTALRGMGTTVVLGLLAGSKLHIANLGDSRAYHLRDRRLRILTEDHTLAASLVATGHLAAEDLRESPMRSHLTAFLGMEGDPAPATVSVGLLPEDRVVFCSDGVWEALDEDKIIDLTIAASNPAKGLVEGAVTAGSRDNATAIVMHVLPR